MELLTVWQVIHVPMIRHYVEVLARSSVLGMYRIVTQTCQEKIIAVATKILVQDNGRADKIDDFWHSLLRKWRNESLLFNINDKIVTKK